MSSTSVSSASVASTEIIDFSDEEELPPGSPIDDMTEFMFAPIDNRILRSTLPRWIGGNRVSRPRLIQDCEVAIKMARDSDSIEVEPLTKHELRNLNLAIRGWFDKHTPPGLQKYAKGQGIRRWSLYQCIQNLLTQEVAELRVQLYNIYLGTELPEVHKAEKGKARNQLSFQMAATKGILAQMSQDDINNYGQIAERWTLSGPSTEVRKKKAVSSFTQEASTFAWSGDLNAPPKRLSQTNIPLGQPVTFVVDFAETMGEHSFYKTNKNLVDGSDVKEAWDTFMLQQLEKDHEGGVDIVGGDRVWPGVQALLILQRNNYGEPILLHPGTLPFEYTSFKPFLVDMIRAMFTMLYGLAMGATDERVIVPWKEIKSHPRNYIHSQYLSDNHLHLFDDPSDLPLEKLTGLADLMYKRQRTLRERKLDAPFFWFHSYQQGNNIVPAEPRALLEVIIESQPVHANTPRKSVNWTASATGSGLSTTHQQYAPSPTEIEPPQKTVKPWKGKTSLKSTKSPALIGRESPEPPRAAKSPGRANQAKDTRPAEQPRAQPKATKTPTPIPGPYRPPVVAQPDPPSLYTLPDIETRREPAKTKSNSPSKSRRSSKAPSHGSTTPSQPFFPSPVKMSQDALLAATQAPLKSTAVSSLAPRSPSKHRPGDKGKKRRAEDDEEGKERGGKEVVRTRSQSPKKRPKPSGPSVEPPVSRGRSPVSKARPKGKLPMPARGRTGAPAHISQHSVAGPVASRTRSQSCEPPERRLDAVPSIQPTKRRTAKPKGRSTKSPETEHGQPEPDNDDEFFWGLSKGKERAHTSAQNMGDPSWRDDGGWRGRGDGEWEYEEDVEQDEQGSDDMGGADDNEDELILAMSTHVLAKPYSVVVPSSRARKEGTKQLRSVHGTPRKLGTVKKSRSGGSLGNLKSPAHTRKANKTR
ncbi:hypothetical protein FA13DRAFT_1717259 [Coprinellus micaceus]|uniref:Uncharacterized protein n=1 Tax=Coprinellus micaceus TaxID=71717 RepID=A0A4Y7SHN3_COPMI|nr:hypothetical protein FA13DRAFT_1717259 [Coprinellus micaceus]